MSAKRRAENELNHDNWDKEEEAEEVGEFQKASEDILKKRVIKTAKRRITNVGSDSERKPIFSDFTGFASSFQSKPASFSFLSSNLKSTDTDNGNTPKPPFSFSAGSSFNTSKSEAKTSNVGTNSSSVSPASNVMQKLSAESKVMSNDKPFSFQSSDNAQNSSPFRRFGKPSTALGKDEIKKTDDTSNIANKAKLNKLNNELEKTANQKHSEQLADSKNDKSEKTPNDVFLQKLRSLNLLCAEWIIKHLNENLSYILTPIFDDYKKHLNQLREERQRATANLSCKKPKTDDADTKSNTESVNTQFAFKAPDFKNSITKFGFGQNLSSNSNSEDKGGKSEGFKFPSSTPAKDMNSFKFSNVFDKKESATESSFSADSKSDSSLFKFGRDDKQVKPDGDNADSKPPSLFSFGTRSSPLANPFFNQAAAPNPSETTVEEDEPPPVKQDVTITEDGAVYEKKCKVFFKKDGNFVDHGVGFLFVKLVGDEQKCQVIVRANNQLASVIVNTLLNSSTPVQKTGKNNVMMICCPTPEAKPTSILIKVKTAEDAEELLGVLKKYIK